MPVEAVGKAFTGNVRDLAYLWDVEGVQPGGTERVVGQDCVACVEIARLD